MMLTIRESYLRASGLFARSFALSIVVACGFVQVIYAQSHSPPMGNMQEMMKGFSGMLGVDMQKLQNVPKEERKRKLKEAAERMKSNMNTNFGNMLGMDIEKFKAMNKDEARALFKRKMGVGVVGRGQDRLAEVLNKPRPAPRAGFADGSVAVPVADGKIKIPTDLKPKRQNLLLIAIDSWEREIVWRKNIVKGGESINLSDIDAPRSSLMLEVIDPQTRRVVKRLRPVSKVGDN